MPSNIFYSVSCDLIFSRVLQFLWFMNPFIKCVMEKGAAGKPLCSGNIAYCMKCIKAFFLAFLPMALGRSASQFIFKIYVSWCSFAPLFFLAFWRRKTKAILLPLLCHFFKTNKSFFPKNFFFFFLLKFLNKIDEILIEIVFRFFLYHRMKVHVKCQFRRWRMTCVPKKIILIFREATRELTLQLFCTDGNSHRKNSGWCRLKVLSCCKISYVFLSFFLSWNSVDDLYHLASKPVGHQAPIPNLEY